MLSKDPEPFPRNGVMYFWYYDNAGKRRAKSTGKKTKKEARKVIKKFLAEQESEETIVSLGEYAQPFFTDNCPHLNRQSRTFSPAHISKSRAWLENHILTDPIADIRMCDMRRKDVIDFLIRKRGELGDKKNTLQKVLITLKTILSEAENREDILRNPGRKVTADYQKETKDVFTLQELQLLFKNRPGIWKDDIGYFVFYLAAAMGLRSGEVRALSWEQIDLAAGTVEINQAWKDEYTLGFPKWDKIRKIPVGKNVLSILKEINELSGNSGLLFQTKRGHLGYTWWRKRWVAAITKSKIDQTGKTLTPHSLRHTLNTLLLQAGIDNFLVQQYLGWTSKDGMTKTQRGYSHLPVDRLKTVSRKIEKFI